MHKMFKIIIISLLVSINICSLSYANEPSACPTPQAIRARGFDSILKDDQMGIGWVAIKSSARYQTDSKWAFYIVVGNAGELHNAQQALTKARKLLTTLTLIKGPIEENGKYNCYYDYTSDSKAEHIAQAQTPPMPLRR